MKRILAAVTAVTLTLGLSLAAFAAPAMADDTTPTPVATTTTSDTTPAPAASTPTATPTATPTSTPAVTPTATPSAAPTDAPAPATTPAATTDATPAPAVAPVTFAAASSTQQFTTDSAATVSYVTVVWSEPTWLGDRVGSFPQSFVSQTPSTTPTLDVAVPTTCGTQFQVDSYIIDDSDRADMTAYLAMAQAGVFTLGSVTEDNQYLAPVASGVDPWGTIYKLVQNAACVTGAATSTVPTCTAGSVTSSNTLTLNAVPGGVWTVTDAAAHYSKTYAAGFGGDATPANIHYDTYTISLADDSDSDAWAVSPYGTTWTPVDASTLDCNPLITVTPSDPTPTDQTCVSGNPPVYTGGSITTDGNPDITYTLTGPVGFASVVVPSSPATPTISGLAPGDYVVTAVANPGYTLAGNVTQVTFPETIGSAVACPTTTTTDTPVVTFVAPSCTVPAASTGQVVATTANAEIQGTIDIPVNSDVTFTINGAPVTQTGPQHESDGTYTVAATLTSAAIAAGVSFAPSSHYTVVGNTATWPSITFTSFCVPTLASWHYGATAAGAVCTVSGQLGTITLDHFASTNPLVPDETGKVTYTLVNNTTHHVTALGATATSVRVAPGSYTVQATPTDSADGLTPNTGSVNEVNIALTVAAATAACGDPTSLTSLAFTGGTVAWLGFFLAAAMFLIGAALLVMKRRARRIAE